MLGYLTGMTVGSPTEVDWSKYTGQVHEYSLNVSEFTFPTYDSVSATFSLAGALSKLSMQQLHDCCNECWSTEGTNQNYAAQYIQKNGLCDESAYPTAPGKSTCRASTCTPLLHPGALTMNAVVPQNETALEEAVAKGPVLVVVDADSFAFKEYTGGILGSKGCGTNVDHVMVLVGYGVSNGIKFWKLKNTWGMSWGESGYMRMSRGDGGSSGTCGILLHPTAPRVTSLSQALLV